MRIARSQTTWVAAVLAIAVVFAATVVSRGSGQSPVASEATPADAQETIAKQTKLDEWPPVPPLGARDENGDLNGDEMWASQATEFAWTNVATSYADEHALPPLTWKVPDDAPSDVGARIASDHAVVDATWLATLPEGEGFRTVARDEVRGADDTVSLTWEFDDLGPAKIDDEGTIDREGHHDRTVALRVDWRGKSVTIPLDDTWMSLSSASYFDRKKGLAKARAKASAGAPLSSFVLGSIRGSKTFEVHATPRGLTVIQEDSTPEDWIPACHDIRQGPHTTCLETPWERIAEIPLDLPANVHLQELVVERELSPQHSARFSLTPPPIPWLASIPENEHFETLGFDDADGPWEISWVLRPDHDGCVGDLTLSVFAGDESVLAFAGHLIGEPLKTSSFCTSKGQLPFLAKNLVSALDEGGSSGATHYLVLAEPNVLHVLVRQESDGYCEETKQGPFTICDGAWSRLVDIRTKAGKTIEGVEEIALPERPWACADSSP